MRPLDAREFSSADMDASEAVQAKIAGLRALEARMPRLAAPSDRARPVVLPAYGGTRGVVNLTPLLALLLRRYDVPVLVHGAELAADAVRAGAVLAELGVAPAAGTAEAQALLAREGIAYLEIADAPQALACLADPFGGEGYRVIGVAGADDLAPARALLAAMRADALLLIGAEGQPFVDPRRPSPFEHFTAGVWAPCESAEHVVPIEAQALPHAADASRTAEWTERALVGEVPVPVTLLAQIGCCLAGARRAD